MFCFDVPEFLSLQPVFGLFLDYVEDMCLVDLFVSHHILNPNPTHLPQLLYYLLLFSFHKNVFYSTKLDVAYTLLLLLS